MSRAQQISRVTILIHKPMAYVSGQAEDGYTPAVALINATSRSKTDRSPLKFDRSQLRDSLSRVGWISIRQVCWC
jgi:23S rRNA pseudouridine2604 synthase